ncbi:MAG TPA: ABC transporter substrate-binding protein [Steroidobacteraceae bacterium]|nr:ABC transporter substrate-binding protein [Steroidobacteraceae bacterium]
MTRNLICKCCCVLLILFALSIQAAPLKVLRTSIIAAESGFDPQRISDLYSTDICWQIFDTVLGYDYLARPAKLIPNIVRELPVAEDGGRVYTFRVIPGIYFADDPAFKGKKRELVAKDLEYSIRRLRDPALNSPYSWLFENKIVGLDDLVEASKRKGKMDYDTPVKGLQLPDRYTLRITLKSPDYNFLYAFAMPQSAPVAREVIEAYADDTMAHPVGTGPFKLAEWVRKSKIVLVRNPNFRGAVLDTRYADMNNPWDREVVKSIGGKKLPLLDRVEIYPIEEEQPRYLAFLNKEFDVMDTLNQIYAAQVMQHGVVAPNIAKQGIRVFQEVEPEIIFDEFNMEDPVVGGYDAQHVALRRAIIMGHNRSQEAQVIFRNFALLEQSPIPPGVVGYDPTFNASSQQDYNPERAKALLDMFGYIDRDGDGYREQPDGSPLVITYLNRTSLQYTKQAELWTKSMKDIGIKLVNRQVQFTDMLRDEQAGKFMLAVSTWIADYPDAQNFLQLLYGPNTGSANRTRFKLPAYDRLYEEALKLPDSPERNRLYREMCRLVLAYAPWRFGVHRAYLHLVQPWVHGFDRNPISHDQYLYMDIDVAAQQAAIKH